MLTLRSPAKLNLYLKVLHKRPDGYHALRTIFERVSLWDDLVFRKTSSNTIKIICDHPQVPCGPRNLAYQAAQLLQEAHGVKQGAEIRIIKRIPVAAGLAGGSSNAATALLGLNRLWGLGLSRAELVFCAKRLGSDVPLFIYNCSWALGVGRGDEIQPLKIPNRLWHVLVTPRIKMYSREVFGALNPLAGKSPVVKLGRKASCVREGTRAVQGASTLKLTKTNDDVNILIRSLIKKDLGNTAKLLANDLESSILRLKPSLTLVKTRLRDYGCLGVAFSGSGPSVYGLCRDERQARDIVRNLQKHYSQVYAVTTL